MYVAEHHKRVRYAETDQMGYLYYGHYAKLYEIGRSEMIRELGVTYEAMESKFRIMMPVLSLESRYKLPARYDELITIRTTLKEMPSKMITFYHEIYNESRQLLNTGTVKLFFVDMNSNKRVSAPKFLTDCLDIYFQKSVD